VTERARRAASRLRGLRWFLDAPDASRSSAEPTFATAPGPLVTVAFPRSGTTLLRAMLQAHPDIAVLPEPWWMMGVLRALAEASEPLPPEDAVRLVVGGVAPAWWEIANLRPEQVEAQIPPRPISRAGAAAAVGRAYAAKAGKPRWGVKFPGAEWRLGVPLLDALFPGATFLFLARDPRDVYLSQQAAGLRADLDGLYLFCLLWSLETRKLLRDLARLGRRGIVARYEDLAEDPGSVLARICAAAGLSTTPAALERMRRYSETLEDQLVRNPIHHNLQRPVLAAGRRRYEETLTDAQARRAALAARAALSILGYATQAARGEGRARLSDSIAVAGGVAAGAAANLSGYVRGRTTLGGIRRDRFGANRRKTVEPV
jgi:hypothetical protein